ncbi:hypothetical protein [Shewanella kaireitica]|uniref:hypothetical protein n=1 Tax=Shewanella kaireitica TaxID=212021 RepID=UPI00200F3A3B|nr:hypothetical protein [Shewanella kaireitica]MCL1092873.1 hypothetical protein [Shewanella kaireitica]
MINKYTITAIFLMVFIVGTYIFQFYFNLDYVISSKPSDWVNFSDYVGGLINPLLGFVSLVLLIQSLNLQNQANKELREEIKANKKNENLRSFETYFFGLIDAQRNSFSSFRLDFPAHLGGKSESNVCAIQELEDQIENLRTTNKTENDIKDAIEVIDTDERIYNAVRIFYNIIKMVSEKLADDKGFDIETRKTQFQTLISFTELSQLRLVMISMQFMDCPPTKYLKENSEFMATLKELGGGADLY